ncbi:MAG: AraC family transcriptional regulator [Vallitaleaceae bacterium]|nr:AraC family transcriptional regulator [Vallitaleaceae bacterium]
MFIEYRSSEHPHSQIHALLGIYPVWLGHLTAHKNYECKPRVLDDFFIIFVSSGEGKFRCLGKDYCLAKNDAFFLFPGIIHSYKTHSDNPLDLWWIGFTGPNAKSLLMEAQINPENPIIKNISNKDLFEVIKEMVNQLNDFYASDLIKASGNIYKMMGILMEICMPNKICNIGLKGIYTTPILRALNFMNSNYPQPISICQVASHSGLSRSHFAMTFKQEVGSSPSTYLSRLRLQNAKRFLLDTNLSITEVAHSVGFQDALYFSKIFSKFENLSPTEYRKHCVQTVPEKEWNESIMD